MRDGKKRKLHFKFRDKKISNMSKEKAFDTQKLKNISSAEDFENFLYPQKENEERRVYITNNRERKVVKRKEKEKKRVGYEEFTKEFSKTNNEIDKKHVDKIFCADSLEKLKKFPDNCIDLIFTSPPYNFGLDYEGEYEDTSKWKDYLEKLFAIFDECVRVIKYGGRIVVNIQPLFSDYIPSHHLLSNYFFKKGLIWKGEILWEKNNYNCKYTAWGSWMSPSNPYLKYTWEFLEVFCKGQLKKENEGKISDLSADDFKKWVVGKWSIAPEKKMKEYGHPAMFPEQLAERVIKLFSYQEDIILDPFNGVGTTTFVAKKLNRKYIGIDISNEYCEIAKKRMNKLDGCLL
jgi:DNA modification methylase